MRKEQKERQDRRMYSENRERSLKENWLSQFLKGNLPAERPLFIFAFSASLSSSLSSPFFRLKKSQSRKLSKNLSYLAVPPAAESCLSCPVSINFPISSARSIYSMTFTRMVCFLLSFFSSGKVRKNFNRKNYVHFRAVMKYSRLSLYKRSASS